MELARTCIGTPYYLSPEICENKPYNNKRYCLNNELSKVGEKVCTLEGLLLVNPLHRHWRRNSFEKMTRN